MSQTENPLVAKFRQSLLKRSVAGIKSIGLYWSEMNQKQSTAVNLEQFKQGIIYHNINMTSEEVDQLFTIFDRNGNGTVDYDEFLLSIRVSYRFRILIYSKYCLFGVIYL